MTQHFLVRRRNDCRRNDARRNRRHHIIAIHFAPLIPIRRSVQVVSAIVDFFTAVPVLGLHVIALLPFGVTNVRMRCRMIVVLGIQC